MEFLLFVGGVLLIVQLVALVNLNSSVNQLREDLDAERITRAEGFQGVDRQLRRRK